MAFSPPTPAPSGMGKPVPRHKSLRAKGFIATLALLVYLLGSVAYVSLERSHGDASIAALQTVSRHEKALALAEAALSSVRLGVDEVIAAATGLRTTTAEIAPSIEACETPFAALEEFDPGYALASRIVARSYTVLQSNPVRENWIDLREAVARASADLEIRRRALAEHRDELMLAYQRQYDAVTVKSLLLALVGIAVFGSLVAYFFARLTRDIRALQDHAQRIVLGQRGRPLAVDRDDELGSLMHAVNQMSVDLDQREKQIEVQGLRRSHHDKMVTMGALAAGVAHEVNNPLAVISGVAQSLASLEGAVPAQTVVESAQQILAQLQRASRAARHLADVAAPQPAELDWVDLNAMVRHAVQLMGYDKRYRHIAFDTDLDAGLSAIRCVGDAVQQMLMQVLSMGCNALVDRPRADKVVRVQTQGAAQRQHITIVVPAALDFARADVQRGLLLSRAIIEPIGGQLATDQDDQGWLRLSLSFPAGSGSEPG